MNNKIDKVLSMLVDMNKQLANYSDRLLALEQGKKPAKVQKAEAVKPYMRVCQQVRADLQHKQLVKLSSYGTGGVIAYAKRELALDKTLWVINEDNETYIVKRPQQPVQQPQKSTTIVVAGRIKATKLARPRGIRKRHYGKFQERVNAIAARLDNGKPLGNGKIAKILHISSAYASFIMDAIGAKAGYQLTRVGGQNRKVVAKAGCTAIPPRVVRKEVKHYYMHQQSGYHKFMSEKLTYYQTKMGMNRVDGFRAATADWNKTKAAKFAPMPPELASVAFPTFNSIKAELKPILIGVLKRLFCENVAITFTGVSYALDIGTENEYKAFVEEILGNKAALRLYFGVSEGKLVWDNETLSLR
jgi:hypothetical protein